MAAELLYQRGLPPQATYTFKHALIQDAAYQSLLRSTRQHYHQRIAQALEERFPETAETQPELLAHHYTEAGCHDQAVGYWQQAGQRAGEHSAYAEAISHLTKGLEVLQTLPDTPERMQQEITLHLALGAPLIATKGYGAPEVAKTYARARELCQQMGETPQLFLALRGLWNCYVLRAELQKAHELGKQLLSLAQSVQDPAFLLGAHRALGTTLFFLGELALAQEHLEQGMALYNPQHHRYLAFSYGADPGLVCQLYAAFALWHLGFPDKASHRMDAALTLAQELSHPYSRVFALLYAAWLHQFRREAQASQEQVETEMARCLEQGFAQFLAGGTMLYGWTLAMQGQKEEGIAKLHQGLAAFRATGAELGQSYFLGLLAEAYGTVGQTEAGLTVLAEALTHVDKTGACWCEAEMYRLKGELLLSQSPDNHTEAEPCFHHALNVARHQQAKSWELRAATSLARLWQRQGKRREARELLAPVYGWFTEGFDTADLKEAKALLDELA